MPGKNDVQSSEFNNKNVVSIYIISSSFILERQSKEKQSE